MAVTEHDMRDVQLGSVSSTVNVAVTTASVVEEVVTETVVQTEETVVQERAAVEKAPPRLEEFPKPQALREGETLILSCRVSGKRPKSLSAATAAISHSCRLIGCDSVVAVISVHG